jgi:hypothetical protein
MDAETMRRYAQQCLTFAKNAEDDKSRLRFDQMAISWATLARNKDRLDGVIVAGTPDNGGSRDV